MKLHLGCGQVYLEGYCNIDFPLDKHSVQRTSVADEFADLTKLQYKAGSIEEVRLHHVFEHFPRAQAIAMLASWHSWLKPGGLVHIEVPDFESTARVALGRFSKEHDSKVAMRHIFGNNEAFWAVHYDGWTKSRFNELMEILGFEIIRIRQSSYLATRNITVVARKNSKTPNKTEFLKIMEKYLRKFTVNDSESELKLLRVWMADAAKQLEATWAKPG